MAVLCFIYEIKIFLFTCSCFGGINFMVRSCLCPNYGRKNKAANNNIKSSLSLSESIINIDLLHNTLDCRH